MAYRIMRHAMTLPNVNIFDFLSSSHNATYIGYSNWPIIMTVYGIWTGIHSCCMHSIPHYPLSTQDPTRHTAFERWNGAGRTGSVAEALDTGNFKKWYWSRYQLCIAALQLLEDCGSHTHKYRYVNGFHPDKCDFRSLFRCSHLLRGSSTLWSRAMPSWSRKNHVCTSTVGSFTQAGWWASNSISIVSNETGSIIPVECSKDFIIDDEWAMNGFLANMHNTWCWLLVMMT